MIPVVRGGVSVRDASFTSVLLVVQSLLLISGCVLLDLPGLALPPLLPDVLLPPAVPFSSFGVFFLSCSRGMFDIRTSLQSHATDAMSHCYMARTEPNLLG